MKAIVAVYDDWGIGQNGTQILTLSADRKFFRQTTRGACVIVGRKTLADFPGGKPLPNRVNLVLTRQNLSVPGAQIAQSPAQAASLAEKYESVFVIGGGSIYRQMLGYCDGAYVTKIHCAPQSDTFFPNLDEQPDWRLSRVLERGEEQGISYEICLYERIK